MDKIIANHHVQLKHIQIFSTKFMLFEIFFNKQPNVGNNKQFVECDKNGIEAQITDESMALASSTAATTSPT